MQDIKSNFMMSKGEYLTLHMKSTTSFLVSKIVAQVLQSKKGNFFVIDEELNCVHVFFLHICDTLSLEIGKNCTCFESNSRAPQQSQTTYK